MIHIASLPRPSADVTVQPVPRAPGGGVSSKVDTVLVIEDDPTMRLALACMLADANRQVVLAHSAEEAMEQLPLIDPDVVLCDFLMDGMNGREFCQKMKSVKRWRYVPIIMVTRMDAKPIIADLLKSGADEVLVKPVRAEQLRARVLSGLRTHAQYLELARAIPPL
jgi:sigma-B regulation protein RsbU (phosphoserine phosphatase)